MVLSKALDDDVGGVVYYEEPRTVFDDDRISLWAYLRHRVAYLKVSIFPFVLKVCHAKAGINDP